MEFPNLAHQKMKLVLLLTMGKKDPDYLRRDPGRTGIIHQLEPAVINNFLKWNNSWPPHRPGLWWLQRAGVRQRKM
jgi:hypothetical protein